ncbi:MAG TPA: dihydropteroate synthase [Woeseiaceae bacterium]
MIPAAPRMLDLGSLRVPVPAVMGILNVTPDSFSDGGHFLTPDSVRRQAEKMAREGAAIIDIGGESTRPGSGGVSEQDELERVIPAIEAVRAVTDLPISIDTSKPGVMRAAAGAGAAMINDVYALQADGALAAAAELRVAVCLMHMRGAPRTMQDNPEYADVVREVADFLGARVDACVAAGIDSRRLVVDPGFGFGKTPDHNVELLANLRQLRARGRPVLVGVSRKSMLGVLTGRAIEERMPASVAAAVLAAWQGVEIIRAHDVQATVDALKVVQAVMAAGRNL